MAADEYDDDDDRPRRPRSSRGDDEDRPARRDDDYDAPRRRGGGGGEPHRGTLILVLGILGLCCGICGIVAFILGIIDIGKMNKGQMDPSGRGMTMAGMIIGIVTFLLGIGTNIFFFNNPNMFK